MSGSGNYGYVVARIKARKKRLLEPDTFRKLLLMDTGQLVRFLHDSHYKVEIEEYAAYFKGSRLLTVSLVENFFRDIETIRGFSRGHLSDLLSIYSERFKFSDLKTILRGITAGEKPAEIGLALYQNYKTLDDMWNELVQKENPKEVLVRMTGTIYEPSLQKAYEQNPALDNLRIIEDELDRGYYEYAFSQISGRGKGPRLFRDLLGMEVDFRNLQTLYMLKRRQTSIDPAGYMLPNGSEITGTLLDRMTSVQDTASLTNYVRKTSYWRTLGSTLEGLEDSSSLFPVVEALKHALVDSVRTFSYRQPLSIVPIAHYIMMKRTEVENLTLLVNGSAGFIDRNILEQAIHIPE